MFAAFSVSMFASCWCHEIRTDDGVSRSHRTAGRLEDGILENSSVSITNVTDAGVCAQLTVPSCVGPSSVRLP